MINIIHPRCAMEEYAKIFRSCVWFNPPHPPTSVEARANTTSIVWSVLEICSNKMKGAIFCQVDKMSPVVRSSPCSTSGNQVCKGASPIFNAKARVIMVKGRG